MSLSTELNQRSTRLLIGTMPPPPMATMADPAIGVPGELAHEGDDRHRPDHREHQLEALTPASAPEAHSRDDGDRQKQNIPDREQVP
jgi:hypothetical protein